MGAARAALAAAGSKRPSSKAAAYAAPDGDASAARLRALSTASAGSGSPRADAAAAAALNALRGGNDAAAEKVSLLSKSTKARAAPGGTFS